MKYLIKTLTYVLTDNFCPFFIILKSLCLRFKIVFRGGSLQIGPDDQSLRAVLVNAVGDLFYTSVEKKVQEDDIFETYELADFQFDVRTFKSYR